MTKILKAIIVILLSSTALFACPQCRAAVQSNVYKSDFQSNFLVMLLPLAVLGAIGIGVFYADELKKKLQKGVLNGKK